MTSCLINASRPEKPSQARNNPNNISTLLFLATTERPKSYTFYYLETKGNRPINLALFIALANFL